MMPRALAHASAFEHNLNAQRQEQMKAHAQSQQTPAPVQVTPAQVVPTLTQQQQAQPLSAMRSDQIVAQQDMVAQRDAVLAQAQPAQSPSQENTQEYAHTQNHEPSR